MGAVSPHVFHRPRGPQVTTPRLCLQIFDSHTSGPLYANTWFTFSAAWRDVWSPWERAAFILRLYVLGNWLSDVWNVFDLVMHTCFVTAIVLRSLPVPLLPPGGGSGVCFHDLPGSCLPKIFLLRICPKLWEMFPERDTFPQKDRKLPK